jgi:uncharacterized protein (DUF4213/DUF364 family)
MLTHIVCWKYKADTTTEQQAEHIAKLQNLKNIIEEVIDLKAGADVLHLERSFDTALVATYADRAALEAYNIHPAHQEVVAFGREIAEKVVSVDFTE